MSSNKFNRLSLVGADSLGLGRQSISKPKNDPFEFKPKYFNPIPQEEIKEETEED